MRVALLADIHGNAPALDAVLCSLPPVDAILCAGDLVGYYPDANEVCDRVRREGFSVIRGNHDAYVLGVLMPDPEKAELYRTDWTRGQLTPENRAWLAALPVEMQLTFGQTRIVLRHASPWDEQTYLYPDSPRLADLHPEPGEVWVFGHTHHAMRKEIGGGLVLNPGSVGQPRDLPVAAAFAILDTVTIETAFLRAPYDHPAYQRRLFALGWELQTIAMLDRRAKARVD